MCFYHRLHLMNDKPQCVQKQIYTRMLHTILDKSWKQHPTK